MRDAAPLLGFYALLLAPFVVSHFQQSITIKWIALGCSATSVLLGWQ